LVFHTRRKRCKSNYPHDREGKREDTGAPKCGGGENGVPASGSSRLTLSQKKKGERHGPPTIILGLERKGRKKERETTNLSLTTTLSMIKDSYFGCPRK